MIYMIFVRFEIFYPFKRNLKKCGGKTIFEQPLRRVLFAKKKISMFFVDIYFLVLENINEIQEKKNLHTCLWNDQHILPFLSSVLNYNLE